MLTKQKHNFENIKTTLNTLWISKPLMMILILASIFRLAAAIFSQGYGMHDDHFTIIESSQSWADDTDYNDWLPSTQRKMPFRLSDYAFEYLKENSIPDSIINKIKHLDKTAYYKETDYIKDIEKCIGKAETIKHKNLFVKSAQLGPVPDGHSFFYIGLQYIYFEICEFLGIENPKVKMLLNRLLHALFSLLTIYFGFKITLKYSNITYAKQIGIFLSIAWFMPFLSVRNLVEVVCTPFLLFGVWYLIKNTKEDNLKKTAFIAGFVMTVAFSVRFQTSIFIIGSGLALLIQKRWRETLYFGLGSVLSIILLQGIIDMIIWDYPFAELQEYILYNLRNKNEYGHNAYEMYFLVLAGIMIPPIGLLYFWGMIKSYKRYFLLFLPTVLFFAFHTYFPNKQERFIFSIIPPVIILGVMSWNDLMQKSLFWQKSKKLYKSFIIFFWIINTIMLSIFSTFYSKKARIESMYYFYDKPQVTSILLEETYRDDVVFLPNYYTGRWIEQYKLTSKEDTTTKYSYIRKTSHSKLIFSHDFFDENVYEKKPSHILFIHNIDLDKRITMAKKYYPQMTYDTTFTPSLGDRIMEGLNYRNRNVPIYVYKTNLK